MIRDVWSCQEEKWSKAKKISQGAAAATALRAAEGGGRRRWSRDLQVLRVTTQREVKSDETSAEFQGETSELENVFGPASSGHQEERRWSKSGRISTPSFEEDAREEHHKKRENTTGQKYNSFQYTQMGHRQSRPNQDDWFSSFLQRCPPSCSLQDTNQREAQKNNLFSCWSYFLFLKANIRVQRGMNSPKPLGSIRRTSVFVSCTSRLINIPPVLAPHTANTANTAAWSKSETVGFSHCWLLTLSPGDWAEMLGIKYFLEPTGMCLQHLMRLVHVFQVVTDDHDPPRFLFWIYPKKTFLLSAEYFPFNNQYRCNDTEVYKYITWAGTCTSGFDIDIHTEFAS